MNRAHRRYARAVGAPEPSSEELAERVYKRTLDKRYNRIGTSPGKAGKGGKKPVYTPLNDAKAPPKAGKNSTSSIGVNVAAADTSGGFESAALSAQQSGGLTKANSPTAEHSLGLDIE
jgi:hypothetical protein